MLQLIAPIDYVHQVLLGGPHELLFCVKNQFERNLYEFTGSLMKKRMRRLKLYCLQWNVSNLFSIVLMSCFIFFCETKRKLRSLTDIDYFKANELKVWLLHVDLVDIFTANMDSLNHLYWQVRNFAPLWCTSATRHFFQQDKHENFSGSLSQKSHILRQLH